MVFGEVGTEGIGGNGRIQRRGCQIRPLRSSKRRRERIGAAARFLSKYRERDEESSREREKKPETGQREGASSPGRWRSGAVLVDGGEAAGFEGQRGGGAGEVRKDCRFVNAK